MSKPVVVIKIDPYRRRIARIPIKPTTRGVASVLGPGNKRHRVILNDVNGEKLVVGCRTNLDPDKPLPEWRIRGCDNFAGVGILFGSRDGSMDYMGHCPVDVAWVQRELVWCEPGENAPAAEVAEVHGIPLVEGDEVAEKSQGPLLEAEKTQPADADQQDDGHARPESGGGPENLAPEEGNAP